MYSFAQTLAVALAIISVLASLIIKKRLQQPTSFVWWVIKVFVTALIPFFAMAAFISIILSIITHLFLLTLPGMLSTVIFFFYFRKVKEAMHSSTDLGHAYGPHWEDRITPGQKIGFLSNPLSLSISNPSAFIFKQDISFCKLPDTSRELLCDLWMPAEGKQRSGLAFIYFHGSAWGVLDKDFGTRPFFKHLVSQGHVIMDVAYRLFPETDMTGMVGDVYRAIAWMKDKATELQISPDRIVIGGASAGAHLSLLAAYSIDQAFVPTGLSGIDLSVHAVISEYGPADLNAMYYHTGQNITTKQPPKQSTSSPAPIWVQKMMGNNFHRLGMDKNAAAIGVLPVILGCYPEDHPEVYAAFSPITYVNSNCPQTLILQGTHDLIAPVEATRQLYQRLDEAGVKVAMYLIPQTDHAFDLILPRISPVAHTAFYLIERFLALQLTDADN